MNIKIKSLLVMVPLFVLFLMSSYTINQAEQVIITQFGSPIGDPIVTPGLHFKKPLIQTINSFDKRYLQWDGPMVEVSTRDKKRN